MVNVETEDYSRRMGAAAEPLEYGASEFELAGLHEAPRLCVRPPRLAESPVAFECRTIQVVRLNPGKAGGGNIVIGEVVHVFVRDDLINDRLHTDPDQLRAIGRMGGTGYTRTRDRFEMPQGKTALEQA